MRSGCFSCTTSLSLSPQEAKSEERITPRSPIDNLLQKPEGPAFSMEYSPRWTIPALPGVTTTSRSRETSARSPYSGNSSA